MNEQFNYFSKNILKGMNKVEDLANKQLNQTKMFHEILPEFESTFWLAHDKGNVKEMKRLKATLDKIIDDLNAGNSFVLDRVQKGA